jgi:hypothetical protein
LVEDLVVLSLFPSDDEDLGSRLGFFAGKGAFVSGNFGWVAASEITGTGAKDALSKRLPIPAVGSQDLFNK